MKKISLLIILILLTISVIKAAFIFQDNLCFGDDCTTYLYGIKTGNQLPPAENLYYILANIFYSLGISEIIIYKAFIIIIPFITSLGFLILFSEYFKEKTIILATLILNINFLSNVVWIYTGRQSLMFMWFPFFLFAFLHNYKLRSIFFLSLMSLSYLGYVILLPSLILYSIPKKKLRFTIIMILISLFIWSILNYFLRPTISSNYLSNILSYFGSLNTQPLYFDAFLVLGIISIFYANKRKKYDLYAVSLFLTLAIITFFGLITNFLDTYRFIYILGGFSSVLLIPLFIENIKTNWQKYLLIITIISSTGVLLYHYSNLTTYSNAMYHERDFEIYYSLKEVPKNTYIIATMRDAYAIIYFNNHTNFLYYTDLPQIVNFQTEDNFLIRTVLEKPIEKSTIALQELKRKYDFYIFVRPTETPFLNKTTIDYLIKYGFLAEVYNEDNKLILKSEINGL